MFTEVLNQVRSFLIDFESPPADHYKVCRFKALPHWLHFSDPEAMSTYFVVYSINKVGYIFHASEKHPL